MLRGIRALEAAGISFHAICVLTRESLAVPDAIFDFFAELGPSSLCFNVEEVDGTNARSSLQDMPRAELDAAYRSFFTRILERLRAAPNAFRVREVDGVLAALRHPRYGTLSRNSQNEPGHILSVAWDGTYTTFSPELLGVHHPRLTDLAFGNVTRDPLPPRADDVRYKSVCAEIASGVARCRKECRYFDFCLGGAPANKLGETGRFDTTETMFCRLTQKATVNVVLDRLDKELDAQVTDRSGARALV